MDNNFISSDYQNINENEIYTGNEINTNGLEIIDLEENPVNNKTNLPPKRWINIHMIVNTNLKKNNMSNDEFDNFWNKIGKEITIFFKDWFPKLYSLSDVKSPGSYLNKPLEERIIDKPTIEYLRKVGEINSIIHIQSVIKWQVRAVNINFNKFGAAKILNKLFNIDSVSIYAKKYYKAKTSLPYYIEKSEYKEIL
jgi:hypothetical protein